MLPDPLFLVRPAAPALTELRRARFFGSPLSPSVSLEVAPLEVVVEVEEVEAVLMEVRGMRSGRSAGTARSVWLPSPVPAVSEMLRLVVDGLRLVVSGPEISVDWTPELSSGGYSRLLRAGLEQGERGGAAAGNLGMGGVGNRGAGGRRAVDSVNRAGEMLAVGVAEVPGKSRLELAIVRVGERDGDCKSVDLG